MQKRDPEEITEDQAAHREKVFIGGSRYGKTYGRSPLQQIYQRHDEALDLGAPLEVKNTLPPNYNKIIKRFPRVVKTPGVLFCYGETIYGHGHITKSIMAHEIVHATAQKLTSPEEWWDRYLEDTLFRYEQELMAHKVEYEWAREVGNRKMRRASLSLIAGRLASPLYEFPIKKSQAKKFILAGKGYTSGHEPLPTTPKLHG